MSRCRVKWSSRYAENSGTQIEWLRWRIDDIDWWLVGESWEIREPVHVALPPYRGHRGRQAQDQNCQRVLRFPIFCSCVGNTLRGKRKINRGLHFLKAFAFKVSPQIPCVPSLVIWREWHDPNLLVFDWWISTDGKAWVWKPSKMTREWNVKGKRQRHDYTSSTYY